MADIQHNTLVTTNLHDPKGMDVNTTSNVIEIDSSESAIAVTISGTCVGIGDRTPAHKLDIIHGGTTTHGLSVVADSLTAGKNAYFYSNSAETDARNLVEITNDNSAAVATQCLKVIQDATATAVAIEQNDDGAGLYVDYNGTTKNAIDIESNTMTTGKIFNIDNANALTTGKILYLYSNSSQTDARNLVEITNDSSLATSAVCLKIQQDAPAYAISVSTANTTWGAASVAQASVAIAASSLTTGRAFTVYSNSSDTNTRHIASIINDNALATGATCLKIQQDSDHFAIWAVGDNLVDGPFIQFQSDSADASARELIVIKNDNVAATGTVPLKIQQDAPTSTNFKKMITMSALTIWISDGTTAEGALTGVAGDICLNGGTGAGQTAFCDANGTNWTDM